MGGLVTGLDIDGAVLARAQAKLPAGQLIVPLTQGSADALPYADATVDCVVSTLVFHHLALEAKRRALQEVYRVLRPGGRFTLADFGPPATWFTAAIAPLVRRLEEVDDNLRGLLPPLMVEAGFHHVMPWGNAQTLLGTVHFLEGAK
jgi:ubiquinone/menaquinone biosynthesis C-methylase UbiE